MWGFRCTVGTGNVGGALKRIGRKRRGQRHGESEASEWTRRQVWGRCGLSSELFDHLLVLRFILSKCRDDDDDDVTFFSGVSAT